MLIRQAREEDVPTLLEWAVDFAEEVLPDYPADREQLFALIEKCRTEGVALVAEENDELRGMIGGFYATHPLHRGVSVLQELAWWVPYQYRNTSIGWALVKVFSELNKTDVTIMSLLHSSKVAPKHMEKLGYHMEEQAWLKRN